MRPSRLFDTELAARLAGYERVNLAAMTEELCGYSLAKGHGAEDWSTTPLPQEWLAYAALDVELLLELAEALAEILDQQGKLTWLEQDCAALIADTTPPRHHWTALKGLGRLRSGEQRARARSLWQARDDLAKRIDVAPGTLLSDKVLLAIAAEPPARPGHLWTIPGYSRRFDEHSRTWFEAVKQARALDPAEDTAPAPSPVPPHSRWPHLAPRAAALLSEAKEAYRLCAENLGTPAENILRPKIMRAAIWEFAEEENIHDSADLRAFLSRRGARPWQVEISAAVLGPLLWGFPRV
ncbi:HRDC domain-containing protein [Corynebacterium lowii]|uniref:Ribonuclease D n=1 Tax=Corynebacterium lowii TaxID=1544413 RepID=A0A0Q0YIJ4_9CORY|nr:HRDC domain-containing protein [Corynebacterium lowii]KQB86517.1 Ribonuclease D [Corynebacterium lowii]MDP9851197.1 ribonuclease D [Corynebacterium lowii]